MHQFIEILSIMTIPEFLVTVENRKYRNNTKAYLFAIDPNEFDSLEPTWEVTSVYLTTQ
jgi:hypothetical protein